MIHNVAWIGTGVMGAPMAVHLQQAGYQVYAFNRSFEKAERLRTEGIIPCRTLRQAVENADAVFSMVGYPSDVEQVYLEPEGVLKSMRPGTVAVDMTTSSPELAVRLAEKGREKGIFMLDAPVSGGDKGAREGTLTIMAGGEREAYDRVLPLLKALGSEAHYMGGAGAGQHTKACNQICVAGATAAYCEALAYAHAAGLNEQEVLAAIGGGAAGSWQLKNMAPRALQGDDAPGFYIKHFIKDMRIVRENPAGKQLEMLRAVLDMYEKMADEGLENQGTQALYRFLLEKTLR